MRKRNRGKGRERKEREKREGGRGRDVRAQKRSNRTFVYKTGMLSLCPTSTLLKNLMIGGQFHFYKLFGKVRMKDVKYS